LHHNLLKRWVRGCIRAYSIVRLGDKTEPFQQVIRGTAQELTPQENKGECNAAYSKGGLENCNTDCYTDRLGELQ
jgi:hypothetical protein